MDHTLVKRYEQHFGLDPKSSDLTRDMKYASGMTNAQYRKSGSVEKRKGFQTHAASTGGFGLFTYRRIDPVTEIESAEIVSLGQKLYKSSITNLHVVYGGAEASCLLSLFYDVLTSQYRCQIIAGTTTVLDLALGLGFDEASPVSVNDLKTAINIIASFTATVTGTTSTPAAFIKIARNWDLVGDGAFDGEARYWTQINSLTANPFAGSETNKNAATFENISAVQVQNVLYLGNGYNHTQKYDGQNAYRAGMPASLTVSAVIGAAGAVTGSNYRHQTQPIQYDAVGNIVEGNLNLCDNILSPVAQKMTVTVGGVVASTGYNTNCAIVAGAQVGVTTITVDDGSGGNHTMRAGDTAFFYNSVGDQIERLITAVAATTITIAGAVVTVADNEVISNNLRIAIYRNKTSATTPTIWYLVKEIANNSFAGTQAFSDNVVDSALGALLIPPATDRSPPPDAKYLSSFQNALCLAGDPSFQNRFYWSDIDGCEYFPADTNFEDVESQAGDVIKGHGPNGSVHAIMKAQTTHVLSGNIGTNAVRIEQKANVGCIAHATIQQVEGEIVWWSPRGPYHMASGQTPRPLGVNKEGAGRMEPVMDQETAADDEIFQTQRAMAINWLKGRKYICFLPAETTTSGAVAANGNSVLYVYDYTRDAWLQWDNLDMAGGACLLEDELFFQGRRYSSYASAVKSEMRRLHTLNDGWSYQDNEDPVDWEYASGWEAMGQPNVLKKFLQVKLLALEEVPNNDFTVTVLQEINYQQGSVKANFDMELAGSGYGSAPYGTDPYGDPLEPGVKHDLFRSRIRSTRLRFTNSNDQENCVLSGWELMCVAPFRMELKQ